jgi:hypothetical protein
MATEMLPVASQAHRMMLAASESGRIDYFRWRMTKHAGVQLATYIIHRHTLASVAHLVKCASQR